MTKTPRQEVNRSTSPPMVGASTGAAPMTRNSRESMVAAARPSKRSRTTAMAITDPAAVPTPCSSRNAPSTAMLGATSTSSEASTCSAVPAMSGRRRPNRSESGPSTSCPSASPTRVPVRVSWTAADVVSSSVVIVGSAGRYMSMVSGPSATKAPRVSAVRAVPGFAIRGSGSETPVGECAAGRMVRSCVAVMDPLGSCSDAGPTLAETPVLRRQGATAAPHSGRTESSPGRHAATRPMSHGANSGPLCMSLVTCHVTVSLDGCLAGPDQTREDPLGAGGERLHQWMFAEPQHEADAAARADLLRPRGAFVMGRNMFGPVRGEWDEDWRGWWGDEPPYHAPVFVLTHHAKDPIEMEGGTRFHFVTSGFDDALHAAKEAARGAEVDIAGGASAVRQALTSGAIDQLTLDVVPVLLGSGERLFDGIESFAFEPVEVLHSPLATHIRYRRVS